MKQDRPHGPKHLGLPYNWLTGDGPAVGPTVSLPLSTVVGLVVGDAVLNSLPLTEVVIIVGDWVGFTEKTTPPRAISVGLDEGAPDDDGIVGSEALVAGLKDVGAAEGDAVGTSEDTSPPRKPGVGPDEAKPEPVGDCVKN